MDIGSGHGYPASALSNFTAHPFVIDEIQCASMEGFLQGLKFKDPQMQAHICTFIGKKAKFAGKSKKWWLKQTLYWKGQEINRQSTEYDDLIRRAYDAMFENTSFQAALKAAGNAVFSHSMGKNDPSKTVLTEREFVRHLNRLRNKLNQ